MAQSAGEDQASEGDQAASNGDNNNSSDQQVPQNNEANTITAREDFPLLKLPSTIDVTLRETLTAIGGGRGGASGGGPAGRGDNSVYMGAGRVGDNSVYMK
uniref:Uncharacterized protein n=1 Tax=Meloidogyne incognita TaxID=6306 RepID=A0A914LXQ4_MELIC